MNTNPFVKDMFQLKWGIDRSLLYHEKRILFWDTLSFVSKLLEFVLNSTACAFLFSGEASFVKWLVLIAAILSFLALILEAVKRSKHHMEQKACHGGILAKMPSDEASFTSKLLDAIKSERLQVEMRDGVILPCVNMLCHNLICDLYDRPEEKYRMTFVERTLGQILPIPHSHKKL